MSADQRTASFRVGTRHALEDLRRLNAGWDGYGAEPINSATIDAALRVVDQLPASLVDAPQVVPMTRGRLQLEWHRGNRSLELEFETPERLHYLKWDSDAGIEEEDVFPSSQTQTVVELLRWFASE
jgi:hypothetical protein